MKEAAGWVQRLAGAVAVLWLAVVGACYLLLAGMDPLDPRSGRASPLEALDAHSLALLAAVILAGIIKRLPGLRSRRPVAAGRGSDKGRAAGAARDHHDL